MTLAELAVRLGCRLEGAPGSGGTAIVRVAGLEDAGPGDVTFLSNPKYAAKVAGTRASAILADHALREAPCPILRTERPYVACAEAVAILTPVMRPAPGISPMASVHPTAMVGPDVSIAAFAVIGAGARVGARTVLASHVVVGANAVLGEDCQCHPHVSIRDGCVLGRRVVLQDGAVIGSDGFGFARRADGTHQKIPQVGGVVIEDDVEIGAHSTIDRPAIGETRIGAGTKIDNLVQIAHGVKVGRNVLLAGQTGIAGSAVLEDDVVIAGQSGVVGHVRLGRGVIVGAKSVVTKDIPPGQHVAGIPAVPIGEWRKATVRERRKRSE